MRAAADAASSSLPLIFAPMRVLRLSSLFAFATDASFQKIFFAIYICILIIF